jgi:hypothetical protein
MDTTHRVVIQEPPNKGLRFLVGMAILYAFWANRRLIAGFVFSTVAPQAATPDGFSSVGTITAVVVPLLVDFVVALGGGGIFIATFGWRLFADIAAGCWQMVANWRTSQTMRARVAAAVSQASVTAQQSAGEAAQTQATQTALQFRDPELARFAEMVRTTVAEMAKRQAMADELLAEVIENRKSVGGQPSNNPANATSEGGA